MRMLKGLLGIGLAIGFGALAQTAGPTIGTGQNPPVLAQSGSQATPQHTATDQSDLGIGGSGDGGMRHRGKHLGDGGMKRHHGKHRADAGM